MQGVKDINDSYKDVIEDEDADLEMDKVIKLSKEILSEVNKLWKLAPYKTSKENLTLDFNTDEDMEDPNCMNPGQSLVEFTSQVIATRKCQIIDEKLELDKICFNRLRRKGGCGSRDR